MLEMTIFILAMVTGGLAIVAITTRLFEIACDYYEWKTGKSLVEIFRPWEEP